MRLFAATISLRGVNIDGHEGGGIREGNRCRVPEDEVELIGQAFQESFDPVLESFQFRRDEDDREDGLDFLATAEQVLHGRANSQRIPAIGKTQSAPIGTHDVYRDAIQPPATKRRTLFEPPR